MKKKLSILFILILISQLSHAFGFLIPMDDSQKNHLKSYGITFWVLQNNVEVKWLLNYRGGSFLIAYSEELKRECDIRGVSYEIIPDVKINSIISEVTSNDSNTDVVKLEKAPKIAVYSPKDKLPWDDAVTLALTYAEIS